MCIRKRSDLPCCWPIFVDIYEAVRIERKRAQHSASYANLPVSNRRHADIIAADKILECRAVGPQPRICLLLLEFPRSTHVLLTRDHRAFRKGRAPHDGRRE